MERTFREIKEFKFMCERLHEISHALAKQLKDKCKKNHIDLFSSNKCIMELRDRRKGQNCYDKAQINEF